MATLQIKYDVERSKVNSDFDDKITKFVEEELRFKWYAQGYDFETKQRDLNFEKK